MGHSALSMNRHSTPVLAILHLCLVCLLLLPASASPSTAPPLLATIDAWFANARNTTPYALAPGIAGVVILGGKAHTFGDGVQVRRRGGSCMWVSMYASLCCCMYDGVNACQLVLLYV